MTDSTGQGTALTLQDKVGILADAAKYDASCASSGTTRRDSRAGGLGSAGGSGICHSYAPDGRCISLLKILMTNFCEFDCKFCINRRSSNVQRARLTAREIVDLTLDFYRRNYIEGLFLSSGIIRSPDYTMNQLVLVARTLRVDHGFLGYIHLKTIPDADPEVIREAGRYADRLSINVEFANASTLHNLAPEKDAPGIESSMSGIATAIAENREDRKRLKHTPRFAPAGQSTQMIIGADPTPDVDILNRSVDLYGTHRLKRVYYSAYSPILGWNGRAASGTRAADARASALSGRLAHPLLRILGAGDHRHDARRNARPETRSEDGLGPAASRILSGRRKPGFA